MSNAARQGPSGTSPAITECSNGVKNKALMEKPVVYRNNRYTKGWTQDCRQKSMAKYIGNQNQLSVKKPSSKDATGTLRASTKNYPISL